MFSHFLSLCFFSRIPKNADARQAGHETTSNDIIAENADARQDMKQQELKVCETQTPAIILKHIGNRQFIDKKRTFLSNRPIDKRGSPLSIQQRWLI